MTKEIVYKKIKEAGAAVKLIGALIFVLGVLFSVIILLGIFNSGVFDLSDLFPLVFLLVGSLLYYFASKLEKDHLSIKTSKIYLIVFTILFLPFIGGLVGLLVVWYTGAALLAINKLPH